MNRSLLVLKEKLKLNKNRFGKSLPISAVGSIGTPISYTHFGQWIDMDPYCLTMTDDVKLIFFFDKNETFGSKRASGQNFRFYAPSYHNVAYKGLTQQFLRF